MTTTVCTSGAVKLYAGSYVSSDLTNDNYDTLINDSEATVNAETNYDWIANWSGLSNNFKNAVRMAVTAHAAVKATAYDPAAYPGTMANDVMNVNYTLYKDAIKILSNKDSFKQANGAS